MFTRLVDELRFVRDNFRGDVSKLTMAHNETMKIINKDYREGSQTKADAVEEAVTEYNTQMEKLREEAVKYMTPFFTEIKDAETRRVMKFDTAAIAAIKSVEDVPMTYRELEVLCDTYARVKDNYWVTKIMSQIAEKNGVSFEKLGLKADYDVRMEAIESLESQFAEMIATENGDDSIKNAMHLHDSRLTKAEVLYSGGLINLDANPERIASRAFGLIANKSNAIDKGVGIRNIFANADEFTKLEFVNLLVKHNVSREALALSGCNELVNEIKEKELTQYLEAKDAMESIKRAETTEIVDKWLNEFKVLHEDNKYIDDLMKLAKKDYKIINDFLGDDADDAEASTAS